MLMIITSRLFNNSYSAFYSVFASVGIIFIGLIVYSRREKRNRIHRQSSINGI